MNDSSSTSSIFNERVGPLFGSLMLIECILGIVGNTLVLAAFATKWVPITPFNMLLLNLSVADIFCDAFWILTLFKSIFEYIASTANSVGFLCSMFNFGITMYIGIGANTATVTYISFIRIESFRNVGRILDKRTVLWFILLTWVIPSVIAIPKHFFVKVHIQTFRKTGECKIENREAFYIFAFASSAFIIILPLLILVINLFRSIKQIWRETLLQQSVLRNERRHITILLFSLTTVYTICFTPYVIRLLLRASGYLEDGSAAETFMRRSVTSIGLLTTISDPIIYALCNKSFRRDLANSGDHLT